MQIRFNLKSFLLFLLFLIIEIGIGIWIKDSFIRPYGGDFLVIFLVYYFLKAFIKTNTLYLVIVVVLFACLIEVLQYFSIANVLNIENKIARTIIGTSFSWGDIVAYTLGGISCYSIERVLGNKKKVIL